MNFTISPAVRTVVKPLVAFYGKTGSGKTLSALLFARGLVGPAGRIVGVDSENQRMSIFADIVPGGFQTIDFQPPFNPDRYSEAVELAEKNADIVLVDSASHEWAGPGGVLDWHDNEVERLKGDSLLAWKNPKISHKHFVDRLLRCSVPVIVCLRGEEKAHMRKDDKGKNVVVVDEFASPIQDPRFLFELLIHFETVQKVNPKSGKTEGGFVICRRASHPDVVPIVPKEDEQVTVAHGEALARWCRGETKAAPSATEPAKPATKLTREETAARNKLVRELWDLTKAIHKEDRAVLNQWLWDEAILSDTEFLTGLPASRLAEVIGKVKTKLTQHANPQTRS